MSRAVKAQGIECPMIREGDNIVDIVVDSVLKSVPSKRVYYIPEYPHYNIEYDLLDKSIIGITESVVARAAGQYVTVDEIAADIEKKFGKDAAVCLVNPIYSRNRFSMILKGIARAAKKIIIMMPEHDEVGNPSGVNPFTGVNIEKYYKEICECEDCEFAMCDVLNGTNIIDCRLHKYFSHKDASEEYNWYSLADICSDKSPDWGLLGTNKATEEKLKLFPSKAECQRVCEEIKAKIKEKTGKDVIVCVYGDGAFKDPVGGIWEFADPITMPGYTDKELIESTPDELKLKSIIDNLNTDAEVLYTINAGKGKRTGKGQMGTTPRIYRDLLASLMDLTSGSGDRATPVVLVQNYF